ncbi:MAG: RNA polymerase sigma-70 factor (ECF subfamily) [Planctomycetota bacterium]|jgi:RNA polymerase sigma-70 factor (ECF subfamily)
MKPPQSDSPSDDIRGYFEEPEAWTQVSQGLQRIAMAIVGNERDAEDVVQGAWLEALRDPERRPSTGWMRRLVRFRALDALRRKRRDPIALEGEFPEEQDVNNTDTRWKIEAQREVLDAVNALKEPYLTTVVLRYFEGKGPKDIATQLGVPERTIKTRLTRAHATLRTRLGARYQDQFGNWAPALLAFSGYTGPKLGSLSLPVTGALLMNKKILIAAVVAVMVCIPFALQTRSATPDSILQPETAHQELVDLELVSKGESPEAQARETLPSKAKSEPQDQATFELAFPSLPASESGSLGIRVRWSDGSPAEHFNIGVMAEKANDAFLMGRTVYTDASGFVKVDRVIPGPVTVFFHRLGSETVEVGAGEYVQVEKEAKLGTKFSGHVLNPQGQPVGGALIFVADSRGGDSLPQPTTVADGSGYYEVKSVADRSYVSARASGYSPSIPLATGVSTGEAMELDLPLRGNPSTLRGLVLSPSGLPVVGAKIHIDLAGVSGYPQPDGRRGVALAFVMESDADGRFDTDQIGAGRAYITARTATWVPWEGFVTLTADEVLETTMQFAHGVDFMGFVREENGDPVPDAHLFVGRNSNPASYRVQTDANGKFRFHGLPPGKSDFKIFQKQYEELRTHLTLRSDIVNQHEFTLHKLQTTSGIVVDTSGAPLARWYVAVESARGTWSTGAETDDEGKFTIVGIPDGTTELIVTTEDHWKTAARFSVPSILPSTSPLRIVAPDSVLPKSSIQMKLFADGKPAPIETIVRLRTLSTIAHRDVHPAPDGSIEMARLANREYHLEVLLEGFAPLYRTIPLDYAEDLDLGTIHLSRGGQIQVQVTGTRSDAMATAHVLDASGTSVQPFRLQDGTGISPLVPEGTVTLRWTPTVGATQFAEVDVVPGETTGVRFTTRPGTDRSFHVKRKGGGPVSFQTKIRVTDAQGRVHYFSEDLQTRRTNTTQLTGLERGSYLIWVQDPEGGLHESLFEVSSLEPGAEEATLIQLDW